MPPPRRGGTGRSWQACISCAASVSPRPCRCPRPPRPAAAHRAAGLVPGVVDPARQARQRGSSRQRGCARRGPAGWPERSAALPPAATRQAVMAELLQRIQHARHRPARKAAGCRASTAAGRPPSGRRRRRRRPGQRIQRAPRTGGQQHLGAAPALRLQPLRATSGRAAQPQHLAAAAHRGQQQLGSAAVSSSRAPRGGSSSVFSSALADAGSWPRPDGSAPPWRGRGTRSWTQSMAARTSSMRIWRLGLRLALGATLGVTHRRHRRPAAQLHAQRFGSRRCRSGCDASTCRPAGGRRPPHAAVPAGGLAQPGLRHGLRAFEQAVARGAVQQQRMGVPCQRLVQRRRQPGQRRGAVGAPPAVADRPPAPGPRRPARGCPAASSARSAPAPAAHARRSRRARARRRPGPGFEAIGRAHRGAALGGHRGRAGRTTGQVGLPALLHPGAPAAPAPRCRSRGRRPGRQSWHR
jgi:hypothetical protein